MFDQELFADLFRAQARIDMGVFNERAKGRKPKPQSTPITNFYTKKPKLKPVRPKLSLSLSGKYPVTLPDHVSGAIVPIYKISRRFNKKDITQFVSRVTGVEVREIRGVRRSKKVAAARHIAAHLCRKHTYSSYPEIGHFFGGRDHSTIIYADNKCKEGSFTNIIKRVEQMMALGRVF